MLELISFNEQRAEFYWWMSSLFSSELTEKDLVNYNSTELDDYFSGLAQTPELEEPVSRLRSALIKLSKREDAQLELAADFCGLFLGTPKTGALPYASMYVGKSGLMNDKPAQDMAEWMEKYGIAQRKEFKEPFDHLSVILDFMGNLIILANTKENQQKQDELTQEQHRFLTTMVLPWLPVFVEGLLEHDRFGFYAAAGKLLESFTSLDRQYLDDKQG